jgi:predicted AlkP superfamily phosphohydrolase/phosphomutase
MLDRPSRVVIIGWDSAPPDLVFDRLAPRMPNFTRLRARGCWGRMRSSDPPITVPAWTCMLTSLNPGALGFYGFRNRRPGGYDTDWIATNAAVRSPRVWDYLSEAGLTCCAHAVPQTYPVKPLNGMLVADFLTPSTDSDYTYPVWLKEELNRVCDGYRIDVEGFRTEDKAALLEQIYAVTDKHHQAVLYLLDQQPAPGRAWDFFMSVEMGPDRLQHGFWKYCDPAHPKHEPGNPFESCLADYYAHLDAQLGEVLERVGEEALVMVVSDHGAKAMKGSVNLNDYFIREGLLVLKREVPPGSHLQAELVDWSRTRAWAWGGYYARVFLNVEGREPQGTIPAGQYERVREEVADLIRALPDDQGRPMATEAYRPGDIFSGPYVDEAPDLMVYFDSLSWRAGQDLNNPALYSFDTEIGPDDAVHDYEGILAMAGPGVESAGELRGLQLMDVAPTVLHHLGQRLPEGLEGKIVG